MNPGELLSNENIYQDETSGGWYAEFHYRGEYGWHRLGCFSSRTDAVLALVRSR